jgi:hypothetical protein
MPQASMECLYGQLKDKVNRCPSHGKEIRTGISDLKPSTSGGTVYPVCSSFSRTVASERISPLTGSPSIFGFLDGLLRLSSYAIGSSTPGTELVELPHLADSDLGQGLGFLPGEAGYHSCLCPYWFGEMGGVRVGIGSLKRSSTSVGEVPDATRIG